MNKNCVISVCCLVSWYKEICIPIYYLRRYLLIEFVNKLWFIHKCYAYAGDTKLHQINHYGFKDYTYKDTSL